MDDQKLAQEWYLTGDQDIDSARFLFKMKPMSVEIICYPCQQCAEKYLKGFITLNGQEVPRIHDLISLNKKCCEYNAEFKTIIDQCIDLTDYGVQMRYPFHIEIAGEDANKALKDAERIKEFVLSRNMGK